MDANQLHRDATSYGNVEAIRQCVEFSEPKSGFIKGKKAGMVAARLKQPSSSSRFASRT